jgi:hypothetical protein
MKGYCTEFKLSAYILLYREKKQWLKFRRILGEGTSKFILLDS